MGQGVHTAEQLIWSLSSVCKGDVLLQWHVSLWLSSAQLVCATVLVVPTRCCPIMGLFALLCHRQLDTGITYSDTSRAAEWAPPSCQHPELLWGDGVQLAQSRHVPVCPPTQGSTR